MRRAYAFSLLLGALFGCVGTAFAIEETHFTVRLSEVQIAGEKSDDEFIELRNLSGESVSIGGWQLRRKTASGSESSIRVFPSDAAIPPGGFYLWANSKGAFASLADETSSSSALANNNAIGLYTHSGSDGVLVDSVAWGEGALFDDADTPRVDNPPKNQSLVYESGEWQATDAPTPENSRGQRPGPDEDVPDNSPEEASQGISISEIYPNPNKDEEEYIELSNGEVTDVSLAGWSLSDASKNGRYVFPAGASLPARGFLAIAKSAFKFALNNSNETITLRNPAGSIVDQVTYGKTKKGVSLNRIGAQLRGGTPTPGGPNFLNTLPESDEKVPGEGYEDIPVSFDARAEDEEDDDLKFSWDFGDGHKSRKAKTSHTYGKTGKYTVILRIDDGKDVVEEAFRITIKKFKAPELQLMALSPNPAGKDSENEWIQIRNDSEETVDLFGWSIASAAADKKPVNHPITESLRLREGETATLTRQHSKFSLNNKAGIVELRAPNKKKVRSVTYRSDAAIAENAIYRHEPGKGWEWVAAPAVLGAATEAVPPKALSEVLTDEMHALQESLQPFSGMRLAADPALKKDPGRILSYGGRFSLPRAIHLTPHAIQIVDAKKAEALPLPLHFLEDWNERLNALFLL